MTTSHPHINTRGGSRFARLLPFVLAASVAAALLPSTALASYGWPVKPFDQPHPVRGLFGDPRTLFSQSPTRAGLFFGGGLFSFHFGVDVSAPDGTPVYAVESGVVDTVSKSYVGVTCEGVAFQYWHLTASVHVGQRIEARSTVLGRILHGAGHVHLTEIDHGRVVDPLLPGHLAPYRDRTTPWVSSIHLRRTDDGPDVVPGFVQGRVELLAEAYDTPNLPVPGEWHGLPVTPALVTWRIEQWNGKVVVPEAVARDVRTTIPPSSAFWTVYARGTYQNMSVFGKHFSWLQPGCYVFRLTPGAFDTRRLKDGVYQLVVTAGDIRGNHSSLTLRFAVRNAAGTVGV